MKKENLGTYQCNVEMKTYLSDLSSKYNFTISFVEIERNQTQMKDHDHFHTE